MDDPETFKPLNPTAFRTHLSAGSPVLTQTATQAAILLLSCYRHGEAANPEIYTDSVISVLSCYSADVIRRVVDPRSGLPSRLKWLPTIAEIKEACDAEMAPIRREQDRRRRLEQTRKALGPPLSDREPRGQTLAEMRLTIDEFLRKHGRPIGPNEAGTQWEKYWGAGRAKPIDPPAQPA
jgi:hypothetical protein